MTGHAFINRVAIFFSAFSLICLSSACGKKASEGHTMTSRKEKVGVRSKYRADFSSLNSSVAGMTSGTAEVEVDRDSFSVHLEVKDSPTFSTHSQFIYEATECPSYSDDKNQDEIIDPIEAQTVLGVALLSLDSDLSSQELGSEIFPAANGIGHYVYSQRTSYSKLFYDLAAAGTELELEGKIIVIHGISEDTYLPATVNAEEGKSVRTLLAIACGKMIAVKEDEPSFN